jgi:hypothetical protein
MKIEPSATASQNKTFTAALSKVATASSASSRAAIEATEATKPSLHTRFVYDPSRGRA